MPSTLRSVLALSLALGLTGRSLQARAEAQDAPAPEAPVASEPATSEPAMPNWQAQAATEPAPAPGPAPSPTPSAAADVSQGNAASPTRPTSASDGHRGRFAFGSYGRIRAASNLRGKGGKSSNIVAFGSRNDLDNYAELELRREDSVDELDLKIVATMAFAGDFFHYDGEFQENIAIRNLFADVNDVFVKGLAFWAGSRMVRGDDVYLLNFWPMDNLNLIGGGTRYVADTLELQLSAGLTRPNNPFYKQTIDVPPAFGFTPASYDLLDRPRTVVAAKGTWFPLGKAPTAFKASLYTEGHRLPKGTRITETDRTESLPSDNGFVVGAQLGGWLAKPKSFVNVFARYASGIAVYDPLSTPMQIGTVTTASGAREWRVAVSSNFEQGMLGLQFGGYMRGLRDEANTALSGGKLLEGAIDVRPYFWFADYAGLSLDAGYQALALSTLDDRTGEQVSGSVAKFAAIPFISPYGKGTYTRPHIHLIYQLSVRDDGARALYPERDRRSKESTEHFFAVGAEWWFDSTSY